LAAVQLDPTALAAYNGDDANAVARDLLADVNSTSAVDSAAIAAAIASIKNDDAPEGEDYVLTTGDDNLAGTTGSDTFTATSLTIDEDDSITDSTNTDSDVLNITATTALDPIDVTGVETINIDWARLSNATIDLENVAGATVVLTSSKAAFTGRAIFDNTGSNNISAGDGVSRTLTVNDIEDATVTATDAETVIVEVADGAVTVNAGVATTVEIGSAAEDITLVALEADDISLTDGYDEADITVGVDAELLLSGDDNSIVTIQSDADVELTIDADSQFEELTVEGEGVVSLVLSEMADADGIVITNAAGTVTIETATDGDLTQIDADEIVFDESGGTSTLTVADGQNIRLDFTGSDDYTFVVDADEDSSSDALTVTLTNTFTGGTLVFDTSPDADIDSVTLLFDPDSDVTDIGLNLNAETTAEQAFTLVSTDGDLAINIAAAFGAEFDASDVEGSLTLTLGGNMDTIVLGAQGDNTIDFAAATGSDVEFVTDGDGDNTITLGTTNGSVSVSVTGSGDTTVTGGDALASGGVVSITLGEGDDTIVFGGAADDGVIEIAAGAGDDTLNLSGTFSDADVEASVDMGAGDDTINFNASASGSFDLVFGAGDDTLEIDGTFVAADLSVTGLETVKVVAAGSFTADSSFLHDATFTLEGTDAGGVATATIDVVIATDTTEFDASGLELDDTIANAFLGLVITVDGDGDDVNIVGSNGDDEITGSAGDDTIAGGEGLDTIAGGTGDNVFVFAEGDSGLDLSADLDVVSDFNSTADSIDLGVAGSLANYGEESAAADGLTAALTAADAAFAASDGDLLYYFVNDTSTGYLFVDFDQDGDADMAIILTGVNAISEFGAVDLV
jgi:predicted  nucleic acid-binding Zn-ribbon protein